MLEIAVGSIVRSPFEKVAVGNLGLMKNVHGRHAEKWVLGRGFLCI